MEILMDNGGIVKVKTIKDDENIDQNMFLHSSLSPFSTSTVS